MFMVTRCHVFSCTFVDCLFIFKGHCYSVKPCPFPTQMVQPCLCQQDHHGPLMDLSLSIYLRGKAEERIL